MGAGGRPPKYKSAEEIQQKIDKYFEDCEGYPLTDENGKQVYDKFGKPIILDRHPLTVTGLALALGFSTRKSLLEYQGKKEFVNAITRAKARVEQYAEERLFDRDGSNGAQFSLRNNFRGWDADRKEPEKNDGGVTVVDDVPKPSLLGPEGGRNEEDTRGGDKAD